MSLFRTRWSAVGAAVAVTLGAGGIGLVSATSPSEAVTFVPITPCRVIDKRRAPPDNVGPKSSPLGAGEIYTVSAHGANGDCTGIPATAAAISMNVTAVGATAPTFLTIWANGETQPEASSLNPFPGAPPAPNAVTTDLSATGQFDIYNDQGDVDVLADINGYYVDHDHDDRYYTQDDLKTILPFANSASTTDQILLTDTFQTVVSVTVQASVGGQVIINSATNVFHPTAGADVVCVILPDGAAPPVKGTNGPGVQWFESEGANSNDATISGTRAFTLAAETSTIFELQCAENGVDGGRTFAAEMTAIFVPTASDL